LIAAGLALTLGGCAALPGMDRAPPASALTLAVPPAPNPTTTPVDRKAVMVESAMAMLGQPYRYGGAAPGGFDCSGLVAYAANSAGIRVPRTATEQLHAGIPVRRRELEAGDLVFMHLAHKELHVGIVVDGDNFIHAPSTGGYVRIDSLRAPPYAAAFLRARRIIDSGTSSP
jgi:cell wall-associated NlpC family hydrolase